MTAACPAGAVSRPVTDWHAIPWRKVYREVRRLQARIVQAVQAGRWGKVKALQRLLARSFSARALAVRRVTEATGRRTPGVDGETWDTPASRAAAIPRLRQRGYRPKPLRRIYIPKKKNKLRPLGIPAMIDRAQQALHLLTLDPVAETTADPNSYGFRKERSPADAIAQCFNALAKRHAPEWILEGDIKACFDTISHAWLERHIPMDRTILHQWLKAGYLERHAFHPTTAGTPQGGPISPVLANLTLDGIERLLNERYPKQTRARTRAKVNFVRFADDFIVTGSSKELLEHEVKPLITAFLAERGLELSAEKTHITHINDGFDFLGQNVRKYHGKLLITPSKQNIAAFLTKVRGLITTHRQTPAGELIQVLNPVIRGWANYHRHVVSKRTYSDIDRAIFQALWRWAKRRHLSKSAGWRKTRYFQSSGGRNWVFFGEVEGQRKQLRSAFSTPIQRHVKLRAEANPYDPAWEVYFEQRLATKMTNKLHGQRQLMAQWNAQDGICPVCNQPLTDETGWHLHHIIWRSHGGPDTAENRVLLHPTCHYSVHARPATEEPPRLARRRLGGLSGMP
jgi:RNA-directed DNA polymerase